MKIIAIAFLLLIANLKSFSQEKDNQLRRIDNFVNFADTLSKVGFVENKSGKNVAVLLEEGSIGLPNKELSHGFSRYIIYESREGIDSVYKISYHDNLRKNLYKDFYYRGNKLVMAKIELHSGKGKILHSTKYYFLNDSLIDESTAIDKVWNKKKYGLKPNVLNNAYLSLNEYFKHHDYQ